MTAVPKPCRLRLLKITSGEGTERSGSYLRASNSRMRFWNVDHLFSIEPGSQVGIHTNKIVVEGLKASLLFLFRS